MKEKSKKKKPRTWAEEKAYQHQLRRDLVRTELGRRLGREPSELEVSAELARVLSEKRERRFKYLDD